MGSSLLGTFNSFQAMKSNSQMKLLSFGLLQPADEFVGKSLPVQTSAGGDEGNASGSARKACGMGY